ncbi:MAG: hypothetical protein LQ346_005795 [Caloplaca aetnensis]|nr:MAG: hypothetical protein LQ346_005795 [Caloplaca aetnensis]
MNEPGGQSSDANARHGADGEQFTPTTPPEASLSNNASNLQPTSSSASEHVSSPGASFGRGLRTEEFIRLNERMDSVTARIQANSVDDFFDALEVTEAAEMEAVQRNILDSHYPPLAPQNAALPRQNDSAVPSEVFIDSGDNESSSFQIPGHHDSPESRRWQLFTISHLLPPAPTAHNGEIPQHGRVERPHEKQVEQNRPWTEQESPSGESRQFVAPAQDAEPESAKEPLDEHQAHTELGRCHKRNRKTKEKLKRRRAERAQREAESRMSENDAGVGPSTIRNEAVPQPMLQAAEMPTSDPRVAEHPVFTNLHPEPPLVDAGLDDSLQERAGPSEAIKADGQKEKGPTRRRKGQGARRRRQQRELRYGTSQIPGEHSSFHDGEEAGKETAEGSTRDEIDVPEAEQSHISPILEQEAEVEDEVHQDDLAEDYYPRQPFIQRFQDPAPHAEAVVAQPEGDTAGAASSQQAPTDGASLTRHQRQNRRSNRYRSAKAKAKSARRGVD